MRLICIPDNAYLFFKKKLESKFPSFAWDAIYAPFPKFALKNAYLTQMLKESSVEDIPSKFILDGVADKSVFRILNPNTRLSTEYIISSAILLPNGTIIVKKRILPQSSLFSKFCFSDYIETCNLFSKENRLFLTEAVFFPRLINRRGTYGDYFAEFLVPFAAQNVSKELPILFDADFIFKSAINDLPNFGFTNLIRIPKNGVKIDKLQVKFPSHYFDNFLPQSIENLRCALPVCPEVKSPSKVYISRFGYKTDPDNRNRRELRNESEVEMFLQNRGYFILRSHEVSNKDSRILLRNAQIIVFNHGSGFVHSAWSSVRSVVEIGLSNWWNPFFLKLCNGMGVDNYSLLMADNGVLSINKLQTAIEQAENCIMPLSVY